MSALSYQITASGRHPLSYISQLVTAPRFVPESNQKYPRERDFIDNWFI